MTLLGAEKESLRIGEYKSFDTARSHLDAAKLLYTHQKWPQSCFMAITAIEEIGKGLGLQAVSAGKENVLGLDFQNGFKPKDFQQAIRGFGAHGRKALVGTIAPLILNEAARERHGKHPKSMIDRIEGVVLLAQAGEWQKIRNICLYTEVNPNLGTADCPENKISREHAYLMIVAALEAYAMVYSPFFTFYTVTVDQAGGNPERSAETVKEIDEFIQQEVGKVDIDRLDFLANPKPLRDRAKRYASRNDA